MGKMKTHKGTKKRVKKTSNGKYKRNSSKKNHLLTKKTGNKKRKLNNAKVVKKGDKKRVEEALPYE